MSGYIIINVIGKVIDSEAQWEELNDKLNTNTLSKLYSFYSSIRVTVENKYSKKQNVFLMEDYYNDSMKNYKVIDFIESLGDKAIKFRDLKGSINKKGLIYTEALSNRFKVIPVRKGLLPDKNIGNKNECSDLFIMKEGVNGIDLHKNCIVTVNGFVHATDAISKGLWVNNGYSTIKKRNKRCIGLISFENIGTLEYIPIKRDMVSKLNNEVSYYNECIVDIPKSTIGKTVILVIGGYLFVLDYDVFSLISDNSIKIKFKNFDLMERIHQSSDDLDIADLLYKKEMGDKNLSLKDLYSDEFLLSYITSPYSFIILLNNDEVFREITYPQKRGIPNSYINHVKPTLPMRTRLGKFEEYLAIKDIDVWELITAQSQYLPRHYNSATKFTKEEQYYNDQRRPTDRYEIPYAYFWSLNTFL